MGQSYRGFDILVRLRMSLRLFLFPRKTIGSPGIFCCKNNCICSNVYECSALCAPNLFHNGTRKKKKSRVQFRKCLRNIYFIIRTQVFSMCKAREGNKPYYISSQWQFEKCSVVYCIIIVLYVKKTENEVPCEEVCGRCSALRDRSATKLEAEGRFSLGHAVSKWSFLLKH